MVLASKLNLTGCWRMRNRVRWPHARNDTAAGGAYMPSLGMRAAISVCKLSLAERNEVKAHFGGVETPPPLEPQTSKARFISRQLLRARAPRHAFPGA